MKANAQVADYLRRYAAALALEGADRFKIKAYKRAAETIETVPEDVATLVKRGEDLTRLPGIGKAMSAAIAEIVASGKLDRLERAVSHFTPELAELATRPALDPKQVLRVYKKLGIHSLRELQQALDAGAIGKALGQRIEYHVRQGLDERPRSLLWSVRTTAQMLEEALRAMPGVLRVALVGSLRRKQDTVGDLNFLIASRGKSGAAIFKRFAELAGIQKLKSRGDGERRFTLSSGLGVSLKWTPLAQWGWALVEATRSPAHLAELQAQAGEKKLRFTAAGLKSKRVDLADEKPIYERLGLSYVEPELREGRGEVAAAARDALPKLVELSDLRGDLHMHTLASDGTASIEQMAEVAQARGYEYIAITDHSQSLKLTNGLTEKRLREQIRKIDKLNAKLKGIQILKSSEVDILEDGKLDYSPGMLRELDLTICSIHSKFGLNKQQQTERLLRAMDNRYFNILGHATGRLLLKRPGYEIDIERIIRHARERGCYFEINSSPDRLDLSDEHAKLARDAGILIAVNTDAHAIRELGFITAGLNQACRAWLAAGDVLNALPLAQLRKRLKRA
jgi:DNA polymerase (family 10)